MTDFLSGFILGACFVGIISGALATWFLNKDGY